MPRNPPCPKCGNPLKKINSRDYTRGDTAVSIQNLNIRTLEMDIKLKNVLYCPVGNTLYQEHELAELEETIFKGSD